MYEICRYVCMRYIELNAKHAGLFRVSYTFQKQCSGSWYSKLSSCLWHLTGWRRPIECLELQINFCKRATNHKALLQNMTYKVPFCKKMTWVAQGYTGLHRARVKFPQKSPVICGSFAKFLQYTLNRTLSCFIQSVSTISETKQWFMIFKAQFIFHGTSYRAAKTHRMPSIAGHFCKRATNYRALLHDTTNINSRPIYGILQGGEDPQGAFSCRSFFANEPQITGLFCGKWPVQIRHPMGLRYPVHDLEHMIYIEHTICMSRYM